MTLTDTHCHLDFEQFDADREEVIRRAAEAGVNRILIPAMNLVSSLAAVVLAQSQARLFAAIGVHPAEAAGWDEHTLPALRELVTPPYDDSLDHGKVVAVGEIGLDYFRDAAPRAVQKSVFKEQLRFAAEVNKPVIIHMREQDDAESGPCAEDLLGILEEWTGELKRRAASVIAQQPGGAGAGPVRGSGAEALAHRPGVLHSFTGSMETAERAMRLGFYIGMTGPVTFKNAEPRRRIAAGLPLDRMLLETDAPFLAPVPRRGRRNEPAFVRYIADKIGEIHSKHPDEVAAVTSANAARLFDWGV